MHTNVLIRNIPVTITVTKNSNRYTVYGYFFKYEGQQFTGGGFPSQNRAMEAVGELILQLEEN